MNNSEPPPPPPPPPSLPQQQLPPPPHQPLGNDLIASGPQVPSPLNLLVQAAEQVSINDRPYSHNTKNASPKEFFLEGSVHHVIAKAFLTCSERGYLFIHWKNDLSQTLSHWQGFIHRHAENNEPMRKRAVAIVGDMRKRLILKARDTNSWYEFNEEIGAVIKEILKLNESSSNEIGIDEFAEFVQKKFNTYYQIGLNLKKTNPYL